MTLKKTALFECHRELGAKLVSFGGWKMPLRYTGGVEEHRAVRSRAGLFDVSHMGEIEVSGRQAEAFLQYLTPNDVGLIDCGQAQLSALLTPEGTFLDDLLVYRLAIDRFLLVVNAGPCETAVEWLREHQPSRGVTVVDRSEETSLLALQGPKAEAILTPLVNADLSSLAYYRFLNGRIGEVEALISRTGYTGEDGFEIYLDPGSAVEIWQTLLDAGADHGILPAGLAARDTLRLEAGFLLSGQDFDRETTPFEVGLGWVVKLDRDDFIGRSALLSQKAEGLKRRLIGYEVSGRGIARSGARVSVNGEARGRVTSGSWSPTLEKALGLAMLAPPLESGAEAALTVEVRGREMEAAVTKRPFYRRPK